MAKRKKNITEAKGTILLVTATKAESIYFNQMRKDCRYMNLTVEHAGSENLSLKQLVDIAGKKRLAGRYQHVWALFGLDEVGANLEELKDMKEYAERKKVRLCWFNPCFELWFALHLGPLSAYITDADALKGRVKSAIKGFEMTSDYLLTAGLNLHLQLFSRHAQADLNARNYNDVAKIQSGAEATAMPSFNECIQTVCGQADMSHNQKAFK